MSERQPTAASPLELGTHVQIRSPLICSFASHCASQEGATGKVAAIYVNGVFADHPYLVIYDTPIKESTAMIGRLSDLFARAELVLFPPERSG